MANNMLDSKTKESIFKQKTRCNLCHEIPIIKEIIHSGGLSYFISAECLNKHGVFFCTLKDFCQDNNQFEGIRCSKCNKIQGEVKSKTELFQYCHECKFMCPSCINSKHKKFKKKHPLIDLQNIDFTCCEHLKFYTGFCEECNINICELCEPNHIKHTKKYNLKSMIPDQKKIQETEAKIKEQKSQIDEINKVLENLLKIVNTKAKEYKDNLNSDLKLNTQIFNCLDKEKFNYQSLVNFDKIVDIDISDIGWVDEINDQLNTFIKLIKEKTPNKNMSTMTKSITTTSSYIDKELMDKFQKSVSNKQGKTSLEVIENRMKYDDFSSCELLKEIAQRNKSLVKNEDIIGDLKDIYILPKSKNYSILIDNGIFLYDQETNDLLCYIDVNDNLEYNDVNQILYNYRDKLKKIYLYIGTDNQIKIYRINEYEEYKHELIQEIKIENLIKFELDNNLNILTLGKNGTNIYKYFNNIYELETENINLEIENTNLFSSTNLIIICKSTKEELLFLDKNNCFGNLFSIKNIKSNEQSQFLEINEKLICLSYENILQIIDIDKKCMLYKYSNLRINKILSNDLINDKQIILSGNSEDKFIVYILEFSESFENIKEKKKIENLRIDIVRNISPNKIIIYSEFGVNALEV